MLIPICTSGKDVYILGTDTLNRGSGMVGPISWFNPPKPCPQSRAFCGTVCAFSIANSTLLNWPIVSLLILFYFILFSNRFFCILVHDYSLSFIGSTCYSVSYYNYISIWPYYIVIHFIIVGMSKGAPYKYALKRVYLLGWIVSKWLKNVVKK